MVDVAIVGAGMAGMAAAARLQAKGLSTLVLEAHGQPGGCAGFYRRKGFAFDVGATTLVDFESGGVGAQLMEEVGLPPLECEALPGYVAWLPDRKVSLYRDADRWAAERLHVLGDSPAHRRLWQVLDRLAEVFWRASRNGIRLPIRSIEDALRAAHAVGPAGLPLIRYVRWTLGDLLRDVGLRDDAALVGLLSMLVEDTVHANVEEAPLINAALGITIRGAGLTRAHGGMWGFWRTFLARYREIGGDLWLGCRVNKIEAMEGRPGGFRLETQRGIFEARQVIGAVPIEVTARIAPPAVERALRPYIRRDAGAMGGAVIVFLGVPEAEVAGQEFTHHQILNDYSGRLGNGNNMFISVSAPGDTVCAPEGHRAVMVSTHCDLPEWEGLSPAEYQERKSAIGARLLTYARKVYPHLGEAPLVFEVGTPQTYARFTSRPRGAVGGVRQTLANSNQRAVPHRLGMEGFWLAGDTTWPGLGTVACVLGSRIVAEEVLHAHHRTARRARIASHVRGGFAPASRM